MEEGERSLQSIFARAEANRKSIELAPDQNDTAYQDKLRSVIASYEDSAKLVEQLSLFSPNETLEDVTSTNLQYMLVQHHLADLVMKITGGDRKSTLVQAQKYYEDYLRLLDRYEMLSRDQTRLLEKYLESPNSFSTSLTSDAAARREHKIARFKEEKELKRKLEYLQQKPMTWQSEDASVRKLHLANIALTTHNTFQALESISQELNILALAPPSQNNESSSFPDSRKRQHAGRRDYSERLDVSTAGSGSGNYSGPLLSNDGKPLRPFTLLDNRQRLQRGVFKPDHNLPTMTIDEYLEEERRRGGFIEGGGPQSAIQPEPDEDNIIKADEETMKARAWDEFKEENPKGSGNTLNRG